MKARNIRHLEHWIRYKFRMFYSCAILFPMTAAAGLPDCSNPSSGICWPFKVARNCLAGISGLELWFRENNRCTILEALKVLVANLHPCLVYCCTSGIRKELKMTAAGCLFWNAPCHKCKHDSYYGHHYKSVNWHFLVLKLKKTIIYFYKLHCCTSQKLINYESSEPFIWFFI